KPNSMRTTRSGYSAPARGDAAMRAMIAATRAPTERATKRLMCLLPVDWLAERASLRLDFGELDHLCPRGNLALHHLFCFFRRSRQRIRTLAGKELLGIGHVGDLVDPRRQLADDFGWKAMRSPNRPLGCLVGCFDAGFFHGRYFGHHRGTPVCRGGENLH